MFFNGLRKLLSKHYINMLGWKSSRKIVVIESDDWGSVRMPSSKAYNALLNAGVPVDKSRYTKWDTLEQVSDLQNLFDALSTVKDINGSAAKFTANAVVANPDFLRIQSSDFDDYYYEPITSTYMHYPDGLKVFEMWKREGIPSGLLFPQFHGREHIHVKRWLEAVRGSDLRERLGFDNRAILGILSSTDARPSYMAAFDYSLASEQSDLEGIVTDGLSIFSDIFGFPSTSFVAPQSIRGNHLDRALSQGGVMFHQCGQQFSPGDGGPKTIDRKWGYKNEYGMLYWRRNVTFEPSKNLQKDFVDSAMREIEIAFLWGKPAVINSHRVNYVGSISAENRDRSLNQLKDLLKQIVRKFPNVEFKTSAELGDLISVSSVGS